MPDEEEDKHVKYFSLFSSLTRPQTMVEVCKDQVSKDVELVEPDDDWRVFSGEQKRMAWNRIISLVLKALNNEKEEEDHRPL